MNRCLSAIFLLVFSFSSVQALADCRRKEANTWWLYQFKVAGQQIAQSEALLAKYDQGELCIIDAEDFAQQHVVELAGQTWLFSYSVAEERDDSNKQLTVDAKLFTSLSEADEITKQCHVLAVMTLGEDFSVEPKHCAQALNGMSLNAKVIALNTQQKKAATKKKSFWDFDSADESAKKRMKKF